MNQTAKGPARIAVLPSRGSNFTPDKDKKMNSHEHSTPNAKSIGELSANVVAGLALRREIANCVEDLTKATAIIRTVWLALASPNFDPDDVSDVNGTLYEGFELMRKMSNTVNAANDAEIAAEVARRAEA